MSGETLWFNAHLATLAADRPGLGLVENGAVLAPGRPTATQAPRRSHPFC